MSMGGLIPAGAGRRGCRTQAFKRRADARVLVHCRAGTAVALTLIAYCAAVADSTTTLVSLRWSNTSTWDVLAAPSWMVNASSAEAAALRGAMIEQPASSNATLLAVPVVAPSLTVPKGVRLIVDVDRTPLVGLLRVYGEVVFDDALPCRSGTELRARTIVVEPGGAVRAGSNDSPFACSAAISLEGRNTIRAVPLNGTISLPMSQPRDYEVDDHLAQVSMIGSKSLVVLGDMELICPPRVIHAKIVSSALAGERSVVVAGEVDWAPGDELGIGPSGFRATAFERAAVVSSNPTDGESEVGNVTTVMLEEPLEYNHTTDGEVASVVTLLSRCITVRCVDEQVLLLNVTNAAFLNDGEDGEDGEYWEYEDYGSQDGYADGPSPDDTFGNVTASNTTSYNGTSPDAEPLLPHVPLHCGVIVATLTDAAAATKVSGSLLLGHAKIAGCGGGRTSPLLVADEGGSHGVDSLTPSLEVSGFPTVELIGASFDSNHGGVRVWHGAANVSAVDCVLYATRGTAVELAGVGTARVHDIIIIGVLLPESDEKLLSPPQYSNESRADVLPAGLRVRRGAVGTPHGYDIARINVYGCEWVCVHVPPSACPEPGTAPLMLPFNVSSGRIGVLADGTLAPPTDYPSHGCASVHGVRATRMSHVGVLIWASSSVLVGESHIADNSVGLAVNVFGPDVETHRTAAHVVEIGNMTITGYSGSEEATIDEDFKWSWHRPDRQFEVRRVGLLLSTFSSRPMGYLWSAAPHAPASFPSLGMHQTVLRDLTFAGFPAVSVQPTEEELCDGCTLNTTERLLPRHVHAVMSNPHATDVLHPVFTERLEWVDTPSAAKLWIAKVDAGILSPDSCDGLACDAERTALVCDYDGSLLGQDGCAIPFAEEPINGSLAVVPRQLLYYRNGTSATSETLLSAREGVGIVPAENGCTEMPPWNLLFCSGEFSFRGLFVHSDAYDSLYRRAGPVWLAGRPLGQPFPSRSSTLSLEGAHTTTLVGPVARGYCFGYECGKRVTSFYSLVTLEAEYAIWFTGTVPQFLRLFHSGSDDETLVLTVSFMFPARIAVYVNGARKPAAGRAAGVTTARGVGTHYIQSQESGEQTLRVVVGSKAHDLQVRSVPYLVGLLEYAVLPEDYAGGITREAISTHSGLPQSQLTITEVDFAARELEGIVQVWFTLQPTLDESRPAIVEIEAGEHYPLEVTAPYRSETVEELQATRDMFIEEAESGRVEMTLGLPVMGVQSGSPAPLHEIPRDPEVHNLGRDVEPLPSWDPYRTEDVVRGHGEYLFQHEVFSALENETFVHFTVVRENGPFGLVSVDYFTESDIARVGQDFASKFGTLNFAPYVLEQTFSVNLIDDEQFEYPDESFLATIRSPTRGSLGNRPICRGLLLNDDTPSVFRLERYIYRVHPTHVKLVVSMFREDNIVGPASVVLTTQNGSARAGESFAHVSRTVRFRDGRSIAQRGRSFDLTLYPENNVDLQKAWEAQSNLTYLDFTINFTELSNLAPHLDRMASIVWIDRTVDISVPEVKPPYFLIFGSSLLFLACCGAGCWYYWFKKRGWHTLLWKHHTRAHDEQELSPRYFVKDRRNSIIGEDVEAKFAMEEALDVQLRRTDTRGGLFDKSTMLEGLPELRASVKHISKQIKKADKAEVRAMDEEFAPPPELFGLTAEEMRYMAPAAPVDGAVPLFSKEASRKQAIDMSDLHNTFEDDGGAAERAIKRKRKKVPPLTTKSLIEMAEMREKMGKSSGDVEDEMKLTRTLTQAALLNQKSRMAAKKAARKLRAAQTAQPGMMQVATAAMAASSPAAMRGAASGTELGMESSPADAFRRKKSKRKNKKGSPADLAQPASPVKRLDLSGVRAMEGSPTPEV